MSTSPPLPYYTILDPPLPEILTLPDVRLDKKSLINHEEQLQALKKHLDSFRDRHHFWLDVSILDKIHYKSLNQHRPFHRFKKLMELRRIIKRFKKLSLEDEIERLYKSFWNVKSLDKCTLNKPKSWVYIPTKESIQYTMHRLIGAALLLDRLKIALIETYRSTSTLLKLEHFVSHALVIMGVCSRLYKLSHVWVNQIEECYHLLYTWSECFPSGFKQKNEKIFIESNNLDCQADTLKLARIQYAQDTMKLKSSNRHKIHLETSIVNPVIVENIQEIENESNINDNNSDDNDDLMDFEDLGEVLQR